jgi:hypothetical protein
METDTTHENTVLGPRIDEALDLSHVTTGNSRQLLDLSVEVLVLIATSVRDLDSEHAYNSANLLSFARTCRQLYHICEALIYSRVRLKGAPQLDAFRKAVNADPSRPALVKDFGYNVSTFLLRI